MNAISMQKCTYVHCRYGITPRTLRDLAVPYPPHYPALTFAGPTLPTLPYHTIQLSIEPF